MQINYQIQMQHIQPVHIQPYLHSILIWIKSNNIILSKSISALFTSDPAEYKYNTRLNPTFDVGTTN